MKGIAHGQQRNSKRNVYHTGKVYGNETWQGKVTWAEKNKSQYFRSALEMLKLMDKALTEEDFPDEEEEE